MRILYLASDWGLRLDMTGGAGTHIRGTIKGFRAHGHEVLSIIGGDVVFEDSLEPSSLTLLNRGRNFLKNILPEKSRLLLRDVRYHIRDRKLGTGVLKKVSEFGPDVIYERSAYLNNLGARLSARFHISHFLETSGCMVEVFGGSYGTFSSWHANEFEKKKLQKATRVVVEAPSAVAHVTLKFDLSTSKVIAKPLGIDPDAFIIDNDLLASIRGRFGLDGKIVVGFVGTLRPYHGLPYLLEAARILSKDNLSEAVFMIVGWGQDGQRYRNIASDWKLENVIFAGSVHHREVASYMAAFHIGIVPDCVHHMFPIKVLEYGLLGLCPLVPDYPVFTGLFQFEGKEASFFDAKNANSLMRAICMLADNRERAKSLSERWKRQVLEQFTWEKTVIPVLSAMEQVTKRRR